jgi:hypothetical protein
VCVGLDEAKHRAVVELDWGDLAFRINGQLRKGGAVGLLEAFPRLPDDCESSLHAPSEEAARSSAKVRVEYRMSIPNLSRVSRAW